MKGKLIVFEGIDGTGKSTHLEMTYQWLRSIGYIPIVTKHPGGTQLGTVIRNKLLPVAPMSDKSKLLLLAADLANNTHLTLKPWLDMGYIILCDRYIDSMYAYQGYGQGFKKSFIDSIIDFATDGLQADLTILLDVELTTAISRIKQKDAIELSGKDFYERVISGYENQLVVNKNMVKLNANKSKMDLHQDVKILIADRIDKWDVKKL